MIIQKGEDCPKCHKPVERRWHEPNQTKHLNKAYYFSEWDYCTRCKHLQHYERYKVWPPKVKISPAVKDVWGL